MRSPSPRRLYATARSTSVRSRRFTASPCRIRFPDRRAGSTYRGRGYPSRSPRRFADRRAASPYRQSPGRSPSQSPRRLRFPDRRAYRQSPGRSPSQSPRRLRFPDRRAVSPYRGRGYPSRSPRRFADRRAASPYRRYPGRARDIHRAASRARTPPTRWVSRARVSHPTTSRARAPHPHRTPPRWISRTRVSHRTAIAPSRARHNQHRRRSYSRSRFPARAARDSRSAARNRRRSGSLYPRPHYRTGDRHDSRRNTPRARSRRWQASRSYRYSPERHDRRPVPLHLSRQASRSFGYSPDRDRASRRRSRSRSEVLAISPYGIYGMARRRADLPSSTDSSAPSDGLRSQSPTGPLGLRSPRPHPFSSGSSSGPSLTDVMIERINESQEKNDRRSAYMLLLKYRDWDESELGDTIDLLLRTNYIPVCTEEDIDLVDDLRSRHGYAGKVHLSRTFVPGDSYDQLKQYAVNKEFEFVESLSP